MVCPQIFSSFHSCAVVSVWDVIARSLGFFQRILPKSSSNKVQLFFSSELVLGGFLGFHGWWKKQDEAPGAGIPEITGVGNLPSGAGDAFSWRLVGLCGNHVLLQSFVSSWGLSTAASCPGFPLFHNSWMASAPLTQSEGQKSMKVSSSSDYPYLIPEDNQPNPNSILCLFAWLPWEWAALPFWRQIYEKIFLWST